MECSQEEILIQDDSGVPGSSPSMPDLSKDGSSSWVAAGGVEGPSSSKPLVECRSEWKDLKNIWMFLWAPIDFIKEECFIIDNARPKVMEKS
jgi:hypothetical protein